MIRALGCAILLGLSSAVASTQGVPGVFDRLQQGPHGVGFRVLPLGDAEGRMIHMWYPAAPRERGCLTFGDYFRFENAGPDAMQAARERATMTFGSLDDALWSRIVATPLRACIDVAPSAGVFPTLVSMFAPGNWTLQSEYFASHGYVVALVTNVPGGRPPPGDMTAFVATQIDRQARSLEALVSRVGAERFVDTSRVGVIGQAPSTFLFAMRRGDIVDGVSLQDSDIFTPGISPNALRMSTGWKASDMRVPFLHVINSDALAGESLKGDLTAMQGSDRYRLILSVPHSGHEDLTGGGYITRRGLDTPAQEPMIRSFEAVMRTQHAFFDAHVRGDAPRRQTLDRAPQTIVAPAVGRVEFIPRIAPPPSPGLTAAERR